MNIGEYWQYYIYRWQAQLFVLTASHPGVSETLKLEYTHTEALIEMLFVLWDYGIPSISSPSSTVMDLCRWWWESGGILTQKPLRDVDEFHLHPPLLTRLFSQPSMPCSLSDAVGSHTHPQLNDWSAIERFHPYLLRPIHVGGSRIASMPSARFFVLACLSFLLPLYILLLLVKALTQSLSLCLYLRCPSLLHLPPGKTVQLKYCHMYCDPSCIACHCRLHDLAGKVPIRCLLKKSMCEGY